MILLYLGRWSYGRFQDDNNIFFKMKNDLTTGTWQDYIWCPIIIISFCTSDDLILSSKSLQLVGVQRLILQSCWTEVGTMMVFWFSLRKKANRLDPAWGKVWLTFKIFTRVLPTNLKWDMILPFPRDATCQRVPDLNLCWESMVESRKVRLGLFVGNNIIGSIDNLPNTKPYLFQLIVKSLN